MINLSLEELKAITKFRKVQDYKSKSEDELKTYSVNQKPKINFSKIKIEDIRKKFNELRDRFSKPIIKEVRRNLYQIEDEKNIFTPKIKEIEKKFLELQKNLFELKKYYDYHDIKCKGIRDVRHLFDLSNDEDYYKPIRTKDAFNNNYIEHKSIGDKDKTLTIKECLDMIRPYLIDITNDHKTQGEWKIHLKMTMTFFLQRILKKLILCVQRVIT